MRPATRRQILADMGVPVWRLRVAAAPVARPDAIARPEDVEALTRDQAPVAPPVETAGIVVQEPWCVLSLAIPGAVMLVDGASSRRDLRLALDVLAAATDDWKARPASRRFDWPPPVPGDTTPPSAEAGRRAMAAFVDKDVGDHGARLLLCVAPLAGLLPESWPGCRRVVVPPLDVLGRDAEAKRALWSAVQDIRP